MAKTKTWISSNKWWFMLDWGKSLNLPLTWQALSEFDAAPILRPDAYFHPQIILMWDFIGGGGTWYLILSTTYMVLYYVSHLSIHNFIVTHSEKFHSYFGHTTLGAAAIEDKRRILSEKGAFRRHACTVYTHTFGELCWGVAIRPLNRHIFTSKLYFI